MTKRFTNCFIKIFIIFIVGVNLLHSQPISQIKMLYASDRDKYDQFGASVSIYDKTVVVGSVYDNIENRTSQGSAYIFIEKPYGWIQYDQILASDPKPKAYFGHSVDIYEHSVVVGAPGDNTGGANSGAAYVFIKDNIGNWVQQAKLVPSDLVADLGFGFDVAIYGDYVIVGALDYEGSNDVTGSAYIFYRNEGGENNWGQVKKITAQGNEIGNWFGFSVDIDDDKVVVGAWRSDLYGTHSGFAAIYQKDLGGENNWGQLKEIKPQGIGDNYQFGYSVSIDRDKVIASATNENSKGTVYLFEKDNGGINNWGQATKFWIADGKFYDYYGNSISISGNNVVIGSINHYKEKGEGTVYLYNKDKGGNDNWGLVSEIVPDDPTDRGDFGNSVCVHNDYAVFGARTKSVHTTKTGAAFLYGPPLPKITVQPESANSVCYGTEQSFSIEGENIDSYQWRVKDNTDNWIDIADDDTYSGTNTSILKVIAKKENDNAVYSCKVANQYGDKYSDDAKLTLEKEVPVITSTIGDQTLYADNNCQVVLPDFSNGIIATDNCTEDLIISQAPIVGTTITGDTNQVTLVVEDLSGNKTFVEFNVSVIDTIKPYIGCIDSKTVRMKSGYSIYVVNGNEFDPLTLSDNCSEVTAINDYNSLNTLNGVNLPYGKTTIVWSAVDEAGNENKCSFDIEVKYPLSANDLSNDNIELYPNPTNGKIYISAESVQEISITDILGKVYQVKSPVSNIIDISQYESGIYLVKIKTERGYFVKKIIKR